jgi:Hint domain
MANSITYYQSYNDASSNTNLQAYVLVVDSYLISNVNISEAVIGGTAFVQQVNATRGWLIYWADGPPVPANNQSPPTWYLGQTLNNTGTPTYRLYPSPYPCFLEGSKILCMVEGKEEYRPIETLRNGTLVKTSRDGFKPVAMIGHSKIYNPSNDSRSTNRLYRCPTKNYPELTEELIITGHHSILVDTLTDEQRKLTMEHTGKIYVTDKKYRLIAAVDERAEPYESEGIFTIWHLALEHENYYMNYGIYANGLLVETTSRRFLKELSGMTLV